VEGDGIDQAAVRLCSVSTFQDNRLGSASGAGERVDFSLLDEGSLEVVEVNLVSRQISLRELRIVTLLMSLGSL
jgi:hypothetical protein